MNKNRNGMGPLVFGKSVLVFEKSSQVKSKKVKKKKKTFEKYLDSKIRLFAFQILMNKRSI